MAGKFKQTSLIIAVLLVMAVLFISSCTVPIKPTNEINPAVKIQQGYNKNLPLKTPEEILREKEEYLLDQEILKDAVANLDAGSCKIMKNKLLQESCYGNLAELKNELDLCGNIADSSTKEGCMLVVAANTLNTDACSKITNREKSNICMKDIAINTSNSDLCKNVNEDAAADECYSKIGIANKNAELCDKITDADKKITCYSTIGVASNSIATCEKIKSKSNPFARDICIGKIAVNTKNLTLCNELKWNDTKKTCIAFTNDAIDKYGNRSGSGKGEVIVDNGIELRKFCDVDDDCKGKSCPYGCFRKEDVSKIKIDCKGPLPSCSCINKVCTKTGRII